MSKKRTIDPSLTPVQQNVIEHSLGLGEGVKKKPYRTHYCTSVDSDAYNTCQSLVALGFMSSGKYINEGKAQYFYVTEAGASAVGTKLPKD